MKKRWIVLLIVAALVLTGCSYLGADFSLEQLLDQIVPGNPNSKTNYTEVSNMFQLRDYVTQQRKEGITEFSFQYSGVVDIDPGVIAQMGDVCYVKMVQEGNIYHLTLTEFPGERMVKAYLSDDLSSLSADEAETLQIALEIVDTAKKQTDDSWELELLLHDMLCDRIAYSDADIYYEKPEDQPRHLSVIGALLDGEANCQGYTDAFYTVASLAGFEVGRLSVETAEDPHMVNTICLNGNWYVVDMTYDDSDDDVRSYRLFNAGMDQIGAEYTWPEETEFHKILEKSDENSYYIRNDLVFSDLKKLADFVAKSWSEDGNTQIHAMLSDESDSEKLNEVLPDALVKIGKSYSYSLWHSSNGIDSFYTIIFE